MCPIVRIITHQWIDSYPAPSYSLPGDWWEWGMKQRNQVRFDLRNGDYRRFVKLADALQVTPGSLASLIVKNFLAADAPTQEKWLTLVAHQALFRVREDGDDQKNS